MVLRSTRCDWPWSRLDHFPYDLFLWTTLLFVRSLDLGDLLDLWVFVIYESYDTALLDIWILVICWIFGFCNFMSLMTLFCWIFGCWWFVGSLYLGDLLDLWTLLSLPGHCALMNFWILLDLWNRCAWLSFFYVVWYVGLLCFVES